MDEQIRAALIGFHGTFVSATGEAPGVNRLEIWGSKGKLTVDEARYEAGLKQRQEMEKSVYFSPLMAHRRGCFAGATQSLHFEIEK